MADSKPSTYAPKPADQTRKDEYDGKWKDAPAQTPADQWGTDKLPVTETPTPFKTLKQVGG